MSDGSRREARLHQPCGQIDLGAGERVLDAVAHPPRLSAEDEAGRDAHRALQTALRALLALRPRRDRVERRHHLEAREDRTLLSG